MCEFFHQNVHHDDLLFRCSTCEEAASEVHNPAHYQRYDRIKSLQHQDSDSSDMQGEQF